MTRSEKTPKAETPSWSAHNLPAQQASPMMRFSVPAMVLGLVVIVLASATSGPITTSGTKMEPARFAIPAQGAAKANLVTADAR